MVNEKDIKNGMEQQLFRLEKKMKLWLQVIQVTLGDTVIKSNAKKVRVLFQMVRLLLVSLAPLQMLALFDRLESKLEKFSNNLMRDVSKWQKIGEQTGISED